MKTRTFGTLTLGALVFWTGCGGSGTRSIPTAPSTGGSTTLSAPVPDTPAINEQMDSLRPTLTVKNAAAGGTGARTYEFQISDSTNFTAATTSYIPGLAATVGKSGVPEGSGGKTSYTPDTDLQPTTVFYWRARVAQGSSTSAWSEVGKFKSKLVGFSRAGELYDPLIHGETVGERVGPTTFVIGKGIRLDTNLGYVKYLLPQTITSGEFSMDVEGLRANAPGDKAKVFGMQEGQGNFIDNAYRVDGQYRGTTGFPPNSITFRALYGSADKLSVRYEPDTDVRNASVFLLDPSKVYHWKWTWGAEVRLMVLEGGLSGTALYNQMKSAPNGTYSPNPHYVYLGAPVGTSGAESASIPGAIYSNVWIGNKPRPASLGSALQ